MRRRRFVRVAVSAALVAGATTLLVGGETPAAFAAGPALVQTGSVVTSATTSVTLTLSSGSTSGNLLIATNVGWGSSNNVSGPAGWTSGVQTSGGLSRRTAILYYASNSGGITSAAFTFGSGTTFIAGQISEWSGMGTSTPIDVTNRANNGSGTSLNVSSGGNTTIEANEIAVTAFQEDFSSATTATFTPGASYTNFGNTGATSGTTLYTAEYETGLASGASPSETETSTVSATVGWLGAIATFAPPATCTGGSLTIGQPNGGVQFNGLNLNGKDRIDNAQPSWTPSDLTGSNAGWNIQLTSTLFTTGSHTLGANVTTVTSASRSTTAGTCTLPTNSVGYPITVPAGAGPPTAVKIYNAAANTGEGVSPINFNISLLADDYSGTYNSTWTVTIASGP